MWTADHLTLKTRVVVKFMSSVLVANDDARTRFSREATAAAAVKSPHVVQLFDHGIVDGEPFIVMELLEGEDLRTRLDRVGAIMLQDVEAMVNQTCKALTQAHRAGIVHRDIKPDNIFLCKADDGETFVKLLDFGLAKKADAGALNATQTGAVMGTPYYMSPEQVIGLKNTDFRTDLWSIGVVAFEAMTGTKAFDGKSIGELAVAILHGSMPVPTQRNPLLPPQVNEWFARACARELGGRFASAKELADAFRTASTGSPVTGGNLTNRSTAPLHAQERREKTAPLVAAKTPVRTAPMPIHSAPEMPVVSDAIPMSSSPRWVLFLVVGVLAVVSAAAWFWLHH